MQMQSSMTALDGTAPATSVTSVGQALLAAMLGLFLIWGVGFSPIVVIHNAAHDTRLVGVAVVLVVDDNIRHYSSFVPVI